MPISNSLHINNFIKRADCGVAINKNDKANRRKGTEKSKELTTVTPFNLTQVYQPVMKTLKDQALLDLPIQNTPTSTGADIYLFWRVPGLSWQTWVWPQQSIHLMLHNTLCQVINSVDTWLQQHTLQCMGSSGTGSFHWCVPYLIHVPYLGDSDRA